MRRCLTSETAPCCSSGGLAGRASAPAISSPPWPARPSRDLTIVGNSGGWGPQLIEMLRARMAVLLNIPPDWYDPGLLVDRGQVKKGILSFPAAPAHIHTPFEKAVMDGKVELELIGQGSLAERMRAAKGGIAAFYTPVGVGTIVEEGKEVREFDGRKHLLEMALKGDFSLIRAHKADRYGNLVYRGSSRTFNATMAGASTVTIAEVDEVVEAGDLDPDHIVTPGIYVQRVVVRPREPRPWDEAM